MFRSPSSRKKVLDDQAAYSSNPGGGSGKSSCERNLNVISNAPRSPSTTSAHLAHPLPTSTMSASMKAYLAEKYMSGPKADAILARTTTKKKKRKAGTSNSAGSGSGAGPSGFVVDDDVSLVAPPKDEEEDDLEDAMVVKDRSFKRRKVDPSRGQSGTTRSGGGEGGSGWTTIQEGDTREDGSPPPTADELPQIAGVVEDAAPTVSGGLLTKAQLRKKLGPKPSEKGKRAEETEEIARQQETVYRDASGRKIDMKAEKAEAARRKREAEEKEAKKLEWGKGLAQREEKEQERAMMEKERHKGFARHADDVDLNEEQKAKELWNDPAAAFLTVRPSLIFYLSTRILTTSQKKQSKGPRKPEYTGPAPPPNRFGIKPGYRWDGVDRSNGFERKYFQRQNERKRQGAESYSWSVDDM